MSKIDDGGPAFPRPMVGSGLSNATTEQDGMSLRDWFAGQALASMSGVYVDPIGCQSNAEVAYRMADAMLKARKAPGT